MQILLVTDYYEPEGGAAAVRLSRLAKILQQRGHQITVLTSLPHYPQGVIHPIYRGKWTVSENRDGIQVIQTWLIPTPSPSILRRSLSQMTAMFSAGLRGLSIPQPDIILIEAQPVFTAVAGIFLAKIKGIPYVLNISDLLPDALVAVGAISEKNYLYRTARRLVDYSYQHAAQIVTLSPVWGERIAEYIGSSEKIHTIYNAVDLERFRPDLPASEIQAFREQYQLGMGDLVTFIGTLAKQYDFPTMLQTVDALPDVQFAFIGSGSQRDILQQAKHRANLRWIDWIDHAHIPIAWNASTLTFWAVRAHPLYHGTIPAKLYEVLACGVPIAAAMEGISAEIIAASGGGQTVACGDADGLVQIIRHLLANPDLREQHKQAARQYAVEHFDAIAVGNRYEKILEMALRSM